MRPIWARLAATGARLAAGAVTVAAVAYLAARLGLGNPLAGLGAEEALGPRAAEELRRLYGLDKPLLQGLAEWLHGLLHGDTGRSIVYGGAPALQLSITALPRTLIPLLAGYTLALLAAAAWLIARGPRVPRPLRAAAFTPGYFYAILLALSSWWLGWPPPLPGAGPGKAAAYAAVVFAAAWPRLLHASAGLLEDPGPELREYTTALQAVGVPEHRIRLHLLRATAAPLAAYASTMLGMLLERSAILEPLLGYTGLGRLLYTAVTSADPVLAATAFTLLGTVSVLLVEAGRLAETLLDPRTRRR